MVELRYLPGTRQHVLTAKKALPLIVLPLALNQPQLLMDEPMAGAVNVSGTRLFA
jgi:hypothetical protein